MKSNLSPTTYLLQLDSYHPGTPHHYYTNTVLQTGIQKSKNTTYRNYYQISLPLLSNQEKHKRAIGAGEYNHNILDKCTKL